MPVPPERLFRALLMTRSLALENGANRRYRFDYPILGQRVTKVTTLRMPLDDRTRVWTARSVARPCPQEGIPGRDQRARPPRLLAVSGGHDVGGDRLIRCIRGLAGRHAAFVEVAP